MATAVSDRRFIERIAESDALHHPNFGVELATNRFAIQIQGQEIKKYIH